MFGIGLGEIAVILFVAFLINPRKLPVLIRNVEKFMRSLRRIKEDFMDIQSDVEDVIKESRVDTDFLKNEPEKKKKSDIKQKDA